MPLNSGNKAVAESWWAFCLRYATLIIFALVLQTLFEWMIACLITMLFPPWQFNKPWDYRSFQSFKSPFEFFISTLITGCLPLYLGSGLWREPIRQLEGLVISMASLQPKPNDDAYWAAMNFLDCLTEESCYYLLHIPKSGALTPDQHATLRRIAQHFDRQSSESQDDTPLSSHCDQALAIGEHVGDGTGLETEVEEGSNKNRELPSYDGSLDPSLYPHAHTPDSAGQIVGLKKGAEEWGIEWGIQPF